MGTHYYDTLSLNTVCYYLLYVAMEGDGKKLYVSIEGDGRNIYICYHEGNESPWKRRSEYV